MLRSPRFVEASLQIRHRAKNHVRDLSSVSLAVAVAQRIDEAAQRLLSEMALVSN